MSAIVIAERTLTKRNERPTWSYGRSVLDREILCGEPSQIKHSLIGFARCSGGRGPSYAINERIYR